jgi:hypothetical protein
VTRKDFIFPSAISWRRGIARRPLPRKSFPPRQDHEEDPCNSPKAREHPPNTGIRNEAWGGLSDENILLDVPCQNVRLNHVLVNLRGNQRSPPGYCPSARQSSEFGVCGVSKLSSLRAELPKSTLRQSGKIRLRRSEACAIMFPDDPQSAEAACRPLHLSRVPFS